MEVVPAALTRFQDLVMPRRREDPLPGPFATCIGVFPSEGTGHFNPAGAPGEIFLVLSEDTLKVPDQPVPG